MKPNLPEFHPRIKYCTWWKVWHVCGVNCGIRQDGVTMDDNSPDLAVKPKAV